MKDLIGTYEDVLHGKLKQFPSGTWLDKNAPIRLLKYLFEEKLKWSIDDIKENLELVTFRQFRLWGMLTTFKLNGCHQAVNLVYPGKIKPWEFKKIDMGHWTKELSKAATIWLIEEKLKWTKEQVKQHISDKHFIKYGINGALTVYGKQRVYNAINSIYPGTFKPWEFGSTLMAGWNKKTAVEATKWLIEEKLKWTDQQIKEKLNSHSFSDNGLQGMLATVYSHSPYKAINAAYPNKFKPWELKVAPQNYWSATTGKEATKWLIEEKLKWSINDIRDKLDLPVFETNGLSGMIQTVYENSPYKAMYALYGDKLHPWEMKVAPMNTWDKDMAKKAVRWLVEEKLGWDKHKALQLLTREHFSKYGISTPLVFVFKGSVVAAIRESYNLDGK